MKLAANTFNVEKPEESSDFLLWQVTSLWQREIGSYKNRPNDHFNCFANLATQKVDSATGTFNRHKMNKNL